MKKVLIISIILHLIVNANAQFQNSDKSQEFFFNPVFAGDYPDPSILRDGEDYYVVHSSFEYYPGLLIWHSKDLVNWTPVTQALHKYVGSVWAPDLIKHGDKYYIYFPANNTNYVVVAESINGPWSDPVDLKVGNIDPGHITDNDGKRYLYFSSGGYVPLSDDGLSVTGDYKHAYDGWPIPREWSIECFCLEGPKFIKKGEYYYQIVAQGGTAGPPTSHMIVAARSKSPFGPWENSPYNPLSRTVDNSEKWWSKGHGTIFEDTNNKWWIIYHGYENGHYNMGRQTLLEPIEWTADDWFRIPEGRKADDPLKKPVNTRPVNNDYSLNDDFSGTTLKPQWRFFGEYDKNRFNLENRSLVIKGKGKTAGDSSPLLAITPDHSYTADIELEIQGKATGGIIVFYNNTTYAGIYADNENVIADLRGSQYNNGKIVNNNRIFLRLKNVNDIVDMYFSNDGITWTKAENSGEISAWHHNALGGFLSVRLGLFVSGEGTVIFRNFKYYPIK